MAAKTPKDRRLRQLNYNRVSSHRYRRRNGLGQFKITVPTDKLVLAFRIRDGLTRTPSHEELEKNLTQVAYQFIASWLETMLR